jgi:peptide/nickel transport system permease protein
MYSYLLRRLLIMIPTFFGISLIVFVVLNLAPGRPGAERQGDTARELRGEATQESYRIFREQFSLDKPTLLNLRYLLTREEVEGALRVVAGGEGTTSAQRSAKQDELEDWGTFAVPHLLTVMNDSERAGETALTDLAVLFLRITARRPLVQPFATNPRPEIVALNREIDHENAEIRALTFALDAPQAERQRVLAGWRDWYERHQDRFQLSFGQKLRTTFVETRFATYWKNLVRLDFGVSLVSREPVLRTLVGKLKYSFALSLGSLVLAYLIAIPLGVFSAVKKDTRVDRVMTVALFMLYSLPSFFVATVLLVVFSHGSDWESLRFFPTGGWQSSDAEDMTFLGRMRDIAWHLVLPLFCLTYGSLAALSRYMRTGLLEVIRSDYVRTARAKGLSESMVIGKHALRNGLMPILTLLAGLLPAVLGGSVIIEYIFGIPGMGLWMIDSIYQRDYNVIMAIQLLSTVLVLLGMLLTDLSYALVDPRIRYS